MTTICYRTDTKEMSSDSSCLDGDTHAGGIRKVWRIGKCLVGFAGTITAGLQFLQWYKLGADDEALFPWGAELHVLVITPDNKIKMYEANSMEPVVLSKRDKYMAIGSGMDVALGALHAGASSADAVRAAIKHNINSKPPVRTYKL